MFKTNISKGISYAVLALTLTTSTAFAASTVVVTSGNTQGWSTSDTRPGGSVTFQMDPTSPYPDGVLNLTTDGTNAAKAQYLHEANLDLDEVTSLSYHTKQIAGPVHAAASYQLVVDLNGEAAGGFTTMVYEPYQNGTVVPGTWQEWDVDAGLMWSSRSFSEGTCTVVAGAGGAPFYTLEALKTACPDATVLGFGVNVGTYNPNYDVYVDGVEFNGTTYDFEIANTPTSKDDCKNGGYLSLENSSGEAFSNQGECVSYFNHS